MEIFSESYRQACVYGVAFAFSEGVIFLIYAGAFYYGAYLIGTGVMDPTSVYRLELIMFYLWIPIPNFFLYSSVFFCIAFSAISVGQATSFIPDYTKANLAAALIFNLIEKKSSIDPLSHEGLRPILYGRVTFSDVHFRYPNRIEYPVLRGLSFDLQPGTTLALVG